MVLWAEKQQKARQLTSASALADPDDSTAAVTALNSYKCLLASSAA